MLDIRMVKVERRIPATAAISFFRDRQTDDPGCFGGHFPKKRVWILWCEKNGRNDIDDLRLQTLVRQF